MSSRRYGIPDIFPIEKVTVNLAPADLKKDGSCLDLPIAMGYWQQAG